MGLSDEGLERLRELFHEVSRNNPAMLQVGDQLTAVLRRMLRRLGLDADDEDVLATMFVTVMFSQFMRKDERAQRLIDVAGSPENALLFALAATVERAGGSLPGGSGSSVTTPVENQASARLDEVPALRDVAEHLEAVSVDDVRIRPVVLADGDLAWLPIVFLGSAKAPLPWALGLRPSQEEARQAVERLLRGLAVGRAEGIEEHPYIKDDDPSAMKRRHIAAKAALEEWLQERHTAPDTRDLGP